MKKFGRYLVFTIILGLSISASASTLFNIDMAGDPTCGDVWGQPAQQLPGPTDDVGTGLVGQWQSWLVQAYNESGCMYTVNPSLSLIDSTGAATDVEMTFFGTISAWNDPWWTPVTPLDMLNVERWDFDTYVSSQGGEADNTWEWQITGLNPNEVVLMYVFTQQVSLAWLGDTDGDGDTSDEVYTITEAWEITRFYFVADATGTLNGIVQGGGTWTRPGGETPYGALAGLQILTDPPPMIDIKLDSAIIPVNRPFLVEVFANPNLDSLLWEASGPGTVTFDPPTADTKDITVTVDTVGEYTLLLSTGSGDPADPNDVITLKAYNPALVYRWGENLGPAGTFVDMTDSITGETTGNTSSEDGLLGRGTINWTTGAIGSDAMDFVDDISYFSAPVADANEQGQVTLSLWLNPDNWTGDNGNIISMIDTGWQEAHSWTLHDNYTTGRVRFITGYNWDHVLNAQTDISDEYWHHVAATFDHGKMNIYTDGVLDGSAAGPDLLPAVDRAVIEVGDWGTYDWGGGYIGFMDDIRVYNYAMNQTEIENLAKTGNIIPKIDSLTRTPEGDVLLQVNNLTVDVEASDLNGDTLTYSWSLSPNNPKVIFLPDAAAEDPSVVFPDIGTYTLVVQVSDGTATVEGRLANIEVRSPTCAEAIADLGGPYIASDLSQNCIVDLADLAIMAADWLRCYDPQDLVNCENPYE
jgi:hypothetical protein